MSYKQSQYDKVIKLIQQGNIFNKDKGNGIFRGKSRPFILDSASNNLYPEIFKGCIEYFEKNRITWWSGELTNHPLSSQVACLNHLFLIRNDKRSVLNIVKRIEPKIVDVFEIATDEYMPAFIQFEATSKKDHLNEMAPTRGSNCTSIDALIYGKHEDGRRIVFPIEWKYIESYGNENKGEGEKGDVRKNRYTDLINKSVQLKSNNHNIYYFEPFYQLMRQTLWVEQLIKYKDDEIIKADDYIHIHIIPDKNKELLKKKYQCSGKSMEKTWREYINVQEKYRILSPQTFLDPIDSIYYSDLLSYLKERYWE